MGKSEAGLWRDGMNVAAKSKSVMMMAHIADTVSQISLREACWPLLMKLQVVELILVFRPMEWNLKFGILN